MNSEILIDLGRATVETKGVDPIGEDDTVLPDKFYQG